MSERHISPEFVDSAIGGLIPVTPEDRKIATINTLSLFRQIKILESHSEEGWNPENLLTRLSPETLDRLSELFAPEAIDQVVTSTTEMNTLGKYVYHFVQDMKNNGVSNE